VTTVRRASGVGLTVVLGGLTAFAALTIDMYLPAMPQLAGHFGTGSAQVQLTLTACLFGLAVGQLVAGPLSDTTGRRGPLLAGLAIYTVVSLACALAPSVWALAGLRLLQALGAAAGVVIARAIVRDLYSGVELGRRYSALMLVTGLAPILAPLIGAQVLRVTDWRGIFVTLAGFGLLLLVVSALLLPETLPPERRRPASFPETLRTCRRLLADRFFLGCTLSCGLSFAVMFAYISGSSFVLQDGFGLSAQQFGIVFGVNAIGIMAAVQVNARLLGRLTARTLFLAGLVSTAVGALVVLVAAVADLGLVGLVPALFVCVASIGLVLPNGTTLAMADHPETAGTASALLGVLQFVVGGLAAPLVGLGGDATALSMALVMAGCGVLSLLVFGLVAGTRSGGEG
jgi:MFS transporter, DHA1 family, multidrug resistance protein